MKYRIIKVQWRSLKHDHTIYQIQYRYRFLPFWFTYQDSKYLDYSAKTQADAESKMKELQSKEYQRRFKHTEKFEVVIVTLWCQGEGKRKYRVVKVYTPAHGTSYRIQYRDQFIPLWNYYRFSFADKAIIEYETEDEAKEEMRQLRNAYAETAIERETVVLVSDWTKR